MTVRDIREAHRIITNAGGVLTRDQTDLLLSLLPPLPKQKTLEEITDQVYDAWIEASGHEFGGITNDPDVAIEDWLAELHTQLQGLSDAPAKPALPDGMCLAEHEKYGRVVVSPKTAPDGAYLIFFCSPAAVTGSFWGWAHRDSLTFIDTEPAPAHPEFLETEEDYENAPEGTIVACANNLPWHKFDSEWSSKATYGKEGARIMSNLTRRVLRWGWGE